MCEESEKDESLCGDCGREMILRERERVCRVRERDDGERSCVCMCVELGREMMRDRVCVCVCRVRERDDDERSCVRVELGREMMMRDRVCVCL